MKRESIREHSDAEPRVLILSMRRLMPRISRCLRYEFEDLIGSLDPAEIIEPEAGGRAHAVAARIDGRWPAGSRILGDLTGATRRASRVRYDLLFVACQDLADLRALPALAPWRAKARFSVCHIEELLAARDLGRSGELALLRGFDCVTSGFHGGLPDFARKVGTQFRYLAFSVDALRWCPYPDSPRRTIDLYAMGRRPSHTHEALLRIVERNPDFFYLYDTVLNSPVTSHQEHRTRLADLIARTRYFLVNVGKADAMDQTGGEAQIGMRYFEGAGAGAVLIGDAQRNAVFEELFGWEDAVIPLPFDSPDIGEVIEALDADPARVERARRRNVVESLRRHDHVYRWAEILAAVGLKTTAPMEERMRRLAAVAHEIESAGSSGAPRVLAS